MSLRFGGLSLTNSQGQSFTQKCATKNDEFETEAPAQRLFADAIKTATAVSNETEKAKAFLLLSVTCDWVDESKKAELLHSGIKALNHLSGPDPKANDIVPYQEYVRSLDNTGHDLTKGFRHLTRKDENSALALVEHVQKRDLRTFALIGVLSGLEDLLATARTEQNSAKP